jgi:hypothetical protein
MLEFDDDEELIMMMMYVQHFMYSVLFLSTLDSLLREVNPNQVIPRLVLANRNSTSDLLHPWWYYKKTQFRVAQLWELYNLLELPMMFVLLERNAPLEEAFNITLMKLATGDSNVVV